MRLLIGHSKRKGIKIIYNPLLFSFSLETADKSAIRATKNLKEARICYRRAVLLGKGKITISSSKKLVRQKKNMIK